MSEKEEYNRVVAAIRNKANEILPKGSQISLYGSRARGDARPDSDWDLHILVPGEERLPISIWDEFGWPFEELGWSLDTWITPRVYSFAGWLKRKFLPFYRNVEKDKIVIFQN